MISTETNSDWTVGTQVVADRIRTRVLDHVLRHNGGYMSQALSSAEIFAMLYTRILNLGPSTAPMIPQPFAGVPGPNNPGFFNGGEYNGPKAPEYDRLIFSPAHYALVLYTALIEVGRLTEEGLSQFDRDGSTVEMIGAEHSPGVETTTGSLAQALSQASGIALARKRRGDAGDVWVMMSDGEFQEGQIWEAIAEAARELVEKRDAWLNPPGLSEKELKKRTLTNLYNQRLTWLDLSHQKLDKAVFAAYGWPNDLSDEEILERLLALNLERVK